MNSSGCFRVATWNLERPKQNGWTKNQRRLNKIYEINADIWVLTETHEVIQLQNYEPVVSKGIEGYHRKGENLLTIWSRWKVMQYLPTFNPQWAVCAELESPFGALIVYGTVIPYANDKGVNGTSKRWEEHRRALQHHYEDWLLIRQQYPNHPMCIAGDFNQSRDESGWYEEKQSIDMLSTALQNLSLKCVTQENFRHTQGLSRSTVDHICLSPDLLAYNVKVGVWEGKTLDGERMSDHNGVFIDLSYEA